MREITKIIVHCSATKPSMNIGASEIDSWHKERGFNCIGYHYVITREGKLEKGRHIGRSGAHCKGHNYNSIGVCLVGGLDENGGACDNFTDAQKKTLIDTLNFLTTTFDCSVLGHRDIPGVQKSCPCFDVREFYYGEEI